MKATKPDKPEGTAQVHNVRFYTIKPRGINCLAYCKVLKSLALSRDDGTIELWDMNYAPYLDRVIQRTPNDAALEATLAWAGKRLFSADLAGKLIEWDLNTLQPRHEHSPTGNALWCLDVNAAETELACGSEEGHINLMSIEHDEINYKMLFNRHDGRVLCCKFDKSGKRLITGAMGAVRIWSVEKGNTLHTMTLSGKDVAVYTLQVLSDNTIIAGDSAGFVTVWNGLNATQLETCKVLEKDVFALALNEQEDRLACSGKQPPLIRILSKTQIKREDSVCERWIRFLQREAHKHSVRALVMIDDRILSGGVDGILCITSSTKTLAYIAKYAPLLQGPCASLAPKANLLLLRYPQSLHLWRLGVPRPEETKRLNVGGREELPLEQTPEKIMQMNVSASKFIQAAAISQDNAWICYSTATELRLNRFHLEPEIGVQRVTEDLPAELEEPASFITFVNSQQLFIIHAQSCQLRCFSLQQDQVDFVYSIDLSAEIKSPISHVELSSSGKYLVVATSNHLIAVWQLRGKAKQSKHLLNLPRYKAGTAALALHENSPRLVVAYADGRIVEYDLQERRFVCETDEHFVPNANLHCIRGIQLDALNPDIVIVYDEIHLYVLESYDRDQNDEEEHHTPNNKAKRLSKSSRALESTKVRSYRKKMCLTRQHLVQVCRLSPHELVTVGIQTRHLLAPLPPPFERKKFGAS